MFVIGYVSENGVIPVRTPPVLFNWAELAIPVVEFVELDNMEEWAR